MIYIQHPRTPYIISQIYFNANTITIVFNPLTEILDILRILHFYKYRNKDLIGKILLKKEFNGMV